MMLPVIAEAVKAVGYEAIEVRHIANGLLQVFIDFPWVEGQPAKRISVDDCEKVSRHLSYTLPVEGIDYQRLEVSSPGLDRLLFSAADYRRFNGEKVEITLKLPLSGYGNRRRWQGQLDVKDDILALLVEPAQLPPAATKQVTEGDVLLRLDFTVSDVEKAQLVPPPALTAQRREPPAAAPDKKRVRERCVMPRRKGIKEE